MVKGVALGNFEALKKVLAPSFLSKVLALPFFSRKVLSPSFFRKRSLPLCLFWQKSLSWKGFAPLVVTATPCTNKVFPLPK